jgi:hypothetical protein
LRLVVDHVDDFCASGCAVYCTCGLNEVGEHVSLVNSFIKKDSNKYLAYLFADTRVILHESPARVSDPILVQNCSSHRRILVCLLLCVGYFFLFSFLLYVSLTVSPRALGPTNGGEDRQGEQVR